MSQEIKRIRITEFLQWNDRNGCYTDENCDSEDVPRMTYEEAIKYFKKAFEASRDVEICTNIIMCYLNLNDLENAKLHLDIAKNLNPDDEIVKQLETMINK